MTLSIWVMLLTPLVILRILLLLTPSLVVPGMTPSFGTDNAVAVVAGNLAATSGFDVISMGNQADNAIAVELTDAVVGASDLAPSLLMVTPLTPSP